MKNTPALTTSDLMTPPQKQSQKLDHCAVVVRRCINNCSSELMPSKVSNNILKVVFHLVSELASVFAEQLAG